MHTTYEILTSFFLMWLVWPVVSCCTFIITNNCPQVIWPGTLAGAGTPQLQSTGFKLDPGSSVRLPAPTGWSGQIWARTGCVFDMDGTGSCETGDCGGRMECSGAGAIPPATLFEITLGQGLQEDYYDVSLVDGYNLPVVASPTVAQGACNITGCAADLNIDCPRELQMDGNGGGVIACRSACKVFGSDEYCCSGEFANPASCKPTSYSKFFKTACPSAYSYAFDDETSTFTCKASDYTIIFCPTINGLRKSNGLSKPQPMQGYHQEREPQELTSSGNMLNFHLSFLLLGTFLL